MYAHSSRKTEDVENYYHFMISDRYNFSMRHLSLSGPPGTKRTSSSPDLLRRRAKATTSNICFRISTKKLSENMLQCAGLPALASPLSSFEGLVWDWRGWGQILIQIYSKRRFRRIMMSIRKMFLDWQN